MEDEAYNSWAFAENIDSFNYFCCPEYVYRCKVESRFKRLALQNYPKSKVLFHTEKKENEQLMAFECVEVKKEGFAASDN